MQGIFRPIPRCTTFRSEAEDGEQRGLSARGPGSPGQLARASVWAGGRGGGSGARAGGSRPRTCDGLEEVGVVLQVVVAVIVVGPLAQGAALRVRHQVLSQRRLQVGHGFVRLLLRVEPHSQPELVLLGGRGTQLRAAHSPGPALPPPPAPASSRPVSG